MSETTGDERFFASDNAAPVHPQVMQALASVNHGHQISYGADPYTHSCRELMRSVFGQDTETYFVYNGTAANVLAVAAGLRSYQAVISSDLAHINTDECGAVEGMTGTKILTVPADDGKLDIDGCARLMPDPNFVHHVQPGMLSLTQSTELGTVYTPDEIRALCDFAHERGMLVHMDGARLANAAVSLGCGPAETSTACGIDILSFGGTKNGLMFGEAVVVRDVERFPALPFMRKQNAQLNSKMRYVAAQFAALFEDDLWKRNAQAANLAAQNLAEGLIKIPGVSIPLPVQANGVFACVPHDWIPYLQRHEKFYVWDPERGMIRLMCSYDTTQDDVTRILSRVREASA